MKIGMKKLVILILILNSLASFCFAAETNQPQPATMQIHKGEIFTITLRANSTTGYQWQFTKPLDETMLQLVNSEYIPYKTKRIGADGKQLWTFKALKAGEVIISLRYIRLWEKDAVPQKEASFKIVIK
jgi:inhibitor of cysteine peptidase